MAAELGKKSWRDKDPMLRGAANCPQRGRLAFVCRQRGGC